jgi:uncharacterized protein YutE (UPF0331/DUF86 family)
MPENAVIQRKLEIFDTTLNHLKGYLPVSYEKLCEDWGLQKIVERSLQILVEIMIDIAQRIIAKRGDAAPQVSADAIRALKKYGIVRDDDIYIKMVRFRNFLVHNYDSLDTAILYEIVTKRLTDFEQFKHDILSSKEI